MRERPMKFCETYQTNQAARAGRPCTGMPDPSGPSVASTSDVDFNRWNNLLAEQLLSVAINERTV